MGLFLKKIGMMEENEKKIAPIRACVAIENETSAATAAIRDRSDMHGTECKERTEKNGII